MYRERPGEPQRELPPPPIVEEAPADDGGAAVPAKKKREKRPAASVESRRIGALARDVELGEEETAALAGLGAERQRQILAHKDAPRHVAQAARVRAEAPARPRGVLVRCVARSCVRAMK